MAPASDQSGPAHAWRHVVKTAVHVGLAILASTLVCELILRAQEPLFHIFHDRLNFGSSFLYDQAWDHGPLPSESWLLPRFPYNLFSERGRAEKVTNSFGMYDRREVSADKGLKLRVFVMGDSFTEGYYHEDTVAGRLETMMNKHFPDHEFEVYNCGGTSYSPLLYFLRLKHQLLAAEPDLVVINVDLTDVFDDNVRYKPWCRFSEDSEPLYIRHPWRRLVWNPVVRHSYLARLIQNGRNQLTLATRGREISEWEQIFFYHITTHVDSQLWIDHVNFLLDNIKRIISVCKAKGISTIITVYPHRQQIELDAKGRIWHREVENRIADTCMTENTPFFSAFNGIEAAYKRGEPVYWPHGVDMHFTPRGQQIWADLVAGFVVAYWNNVRN